MMSNGALQLEELFSKLDALDDQTRRNAAVSIYENRHEAMLDYLINALNNKDPYVKWFVIKTLGDLEITKSIQHLINIFYEADYDFPNDTSLHAITAYALSKIGNPALKAVLAIVDDDNPVVRKCAVDTLGEMKNAAALHVLGEKFENDKEYQVQLWAALSLAKLGDISIPILERIAISDPDPQKVILSIDALIKIGTATAQNVLEKLSKDVILSNIFDQAKCWQNSTKK